MMAFRIAVFFALFCALTGVIQGVMTSEYTDTPWFPGATYPGVDSNAVIDKNNITEGTNAMVPGSDMLTDSGSAIKQISVFRVMWDALKNVFYIRPMIADALYIPSPEDKTVNLFDPFSWIVQIGIYLIYAMGMYQAYSKVQMKYAY